MGSSGIFDVDVMRPLMEKIAAEMSAKIDWDVMSSFLEQEGWAKVAIAPHRGRPEMIQWADQYCSGQCRHYSYEFMFENEKDAILFSLRWV